MISYDKLVKILKGNGLKKSDLTKVLGISSRTIVKIGKGERIADNVLRKIAEYFGCLVETCIVKFAIIPFYRFCVKKWKTRFRADCITKRRSV